MTGDGSRDERAIALGGLPAISVGDPADAAFVLVLLHGFMMGPADLSPFARSIGLPGWYLYPRGPIQVARAHSAPGSESGAVGAQEGWAWWQMDPVEREAAIARGPRDFATQNPPDLPAARRLLASFLDAVEVALGPRRRPLIVGGFSQGGMLVCDTLLRAERRVDGLVLLSTSRIACADWVPHLASGCLRGVPTLMSHGQADLDLSFSAGEGLRAALASGGAEVEWIPFPEGHVIPLVVWRRLRKFLQARAATPQPQARKGVDD